MNVPHAIQQYENAQCQGKIERLLQMKELCKQGYQMSGSPPLGNISVLLLHLKSRIQI